MSFSIELNNPDAHSKSKGSPNLKVPRISTVSGFVREMLALKIDGKDPTAFRGQCDHSWPGQAPIFRNENQLLHFEEAMMKEIISVHPQEFLQDETMFDRLVRMQHYGLPTRLLDVTLNPLVALFFASQDNVKEVEKDGSVRRYPTDGKVIAYKVPESRAKYFDSNSVSCLSNLSNLTFEEKMFLQSAGLSVSREDFNTSSEVKRLLDCVRMEKSHFRAEIDPITLYRPLFVKPKNNNRRIIAQSGAFIIFGLDVPVGSDKPYERNIRMVYFRIPADAKAGIRRELSRLGIDAAVLFPELEKSALIISNKYKGLPSFDSSVC